MEPPAASMAARAPFVTARPLIRTARSRLPDAMTLTRFVYPGTRPALIKASRPIVSSFSPLSSFSRSSALRRALGDALDPLPKNKKIATSVLSTRGHSLFVKSIRRLYAEGYTLGGGRPT